MDKKIASIIKYFAVFDYFPNFMDVYTFFPGKITKKKLKKILEASKYTPPQYSIPTSPRLRGASKYQISKRKLNNWRYKAYIQLISLFPQIRLVGLSGSISMLNAKENDDIDLFIITAKNRLFTGRLIALFLAQILGLRRVWDSETSHQSLVTNHHANKVCLNLFFDERNLKVPKFKQTEFVGHEVLQMKPIIIKGDVYKRFLEANKWVFRLFPNASHVIPAPDRSRGQAPAGIQTKSTGSPTGSGMTESILKKFQLRLINKHKTTEIITPTQLWFHPNDYNSFM